MGRTSGGGLVVAPVGFHASAFAVHVPRSRPIGETPIWPVFIASFRDHDENPVNPEELFSAAAEHRIGMADLAGPGLEEDAVARKVFQVPRPFRTLLRLG